MSWRTLLDEGTIIRGNVSVMRVFLQHVNLQLNLLFFILNTHTHTHSGSFSTDVQFLLLLLFMDLYNTVNYIFIGFVEQTDVRSVAL